MAGVPHRGDHAIGAVPDVELPDLDHGPTHSPEPGDAIRITGAIDTCRVEEVALHLDDHPELSIAEVDPPDPAVVVAEVDLTLEGRLAGLSEDRLEPVLETALDRAVIGPSLEREPTDRRGATRPAPAGEGGDVLVELPDLEQVPGEHPLTQEIEAVPVQATGEVAQRPER